ncbi:capsule assembly Wzi family protein [Pelagicoccus sp. SDUM812002]|uniref:capsule assembly Wzi family protein n=1 Tax=Pelagicoccus sp. SDUM812002 TaxID=3041266 RepID=UPI00280DFAE0|nr:capsule assembly Wzi family protein [Pelagicoccus sp. SDUM812002]MDQ8186824.1 capsule assembly Wzi family protein [Pelagicoccus sp. SDUM812002]
MTFKADPIPSRTLFNFNSVVAALFLVSTPLVAKNSIEPGDEALRHHLQLLVDEGVINTLSTTWPLSDKEIASSIASLNEDELTAEQSQSLNALQQRLLNTASASTVIQYGNRRQELRGFADDFREQGEIRFKSSEQVGLFTFHLQASAVDNPLDDKEVRLDGSYIAVDLKNWQFGAGAVDRWWGPGWQGSLILSNNARPSPGIFLNRNTTKAFNLPVLRMLGPWSFSSFANQLESDRHIPEAKLLGARFTFKPIDSLEVGLTRTAQWGGDGRPETWDSLKDLILGNDNVGDGGIELDGSNEPGNQLGGIDLRWTTRFADQSVTFYGQLIGEDEAGGFPSRKIGLFGVETPVNTDWSNGRIFLEASDTTMDFLDDRFANSAYNHSIYQSGYRYRGNAIGASTDNDSRLLTLGGMHEIGPLNSLTWKAQYASLNRDGSPGRNTVASSHEQTGIVSAKFERKLNEQVCLGVNATHILNDVTPDSRISKSSIQVSLTIQN